jgi:ADP-ribose pyrophosphatase YjhB (NUDIX family)
MGYIEDLRKKIGHSPIIMVGAAALIFNEQNELLLLHRTDNGCWGIPGGALEPGESLEDTARRETREESGLNIEA